MAPFDLPTVIAYAGVMSCMMGLILAFLAQTYPRSIRGLNLWAAGTLVTGLATLSRIWLRSVAADEVSIGAQNVCLILTAGLFLGGTMAFFERPLPKAFLPLLLLISVLAMAFFARYDQNAAHRRLFARVILIGLYAYHAWFIYRQTPTVIRSLAIGTLGLLVLLLILRTLTGYQSPSVDGVDSAALIQVVYAIGFSSTDVLIPILGILMTSEKIRITLEQLAMQDSLTGALTRRALFELGEKELAGCQREDQPFSILMLDLDQFKAINDTLGHQVGDLVLQDFAQRVMGLLRRPAQLARYGGDEFMVLLPRTSADEAAQIAERIRTSRPRRSDLPDGHVSIGMAFNLPTQRQSLDDLISQADQGLSLAKQGGRDRIEMAPAASPHPGMAAMPWEAA